MPYGVVDAVDPTDLTTTLIESATSGSTRLWPADPTLFVPEGGRMFADVLLPAAGDGESEEEVTAELEYDSVDEDGWITLSEPLPLDLDAIDASLRPSPAVTILEASIIPDHSDEPLTCKVQHSVALSAALEQGDRLETAGVRVRYEYIGGEPMVVDVVGRRPSVPVANIDGDLGSTDGEPPATSPTPEVIDGIGMVWVRLPLVENADPVTVKVFASRTPGVVADELTLEGVAPNGGTVPIGTIGGVPLEVGDDVHVRARADDADGAGPVSVEVSGTVLEVGFEQVSQAIKDQITAADGKATDAQADAQRAIDDALVAFLAAQAADGKATTAQSTADSKASPDDVEAARASAVSTSASDAQSRANAAQANAIAQAALDANLINNTTKTGTTTGMSATGGGTLAVVTEDFFGTPTRALRSRSQGSTQNLLGFYPVDASKAYEITIWLKDTALVPGNQIYLGLNGTNSDGSTSAFEPVLDGSGALTAPTTNYYAWYDSTPPLNTWREHTFYVLPYGADPLDVVGMGKNVHSHARMPANINRLQVRFLNWANTASTGDRDVSAAHMAVRPVSLETIRQARLAQAAATTADGKAVAAQTAATNAQNTANSKGKVIIDSAAPATADRLAQNLWIDTSPVGDPPVPGNVGKRWNGTAWVAVQDAGIQAAAAQAAAAQQKADDALEAATQAVATATGKNSNSASPAPSPSTSGRVNGDLHYVRAGEDPENPDADPMRIVRIQQLTDGAWVDLPIDVQVVAQLDAAYVNSLLVASDTFLGRLAAFEQVTAEMVASDVMVTNEFYARDGIHAGDGSGAGLDFDLQNGFIQRGPDGQPVLAFPITGVGNFFKGDLTVDSARAQKFVLLGRENLVVRNGRLMLASSIEAPPAPLVRVDYPRYERNDPGAFSTQIREPYYVQDVGDERHFFAVIGSTPMRLIWNRVTNVVSREIAAGWNGATGYSIAFTNDTIYRLTLGSSTDTVHGRNLTTGATTSVARNRTGNARGITVRDGVLYWWRQITATASTSTLEVYTLNPTSGATSLAHTTSLPFPASDPTLVTNVRIGRFGGAAGSTRFMVTYGPGGNRSTLLIRGSTDQSIYPLPASEFADAHPFWSAPDDGSAATMLVTGGLFTSSAAFVSLDLAMSGFQGPVEFATTWARGDARTYETEASPSVVRTIPAGCRLRVDPGQWPPESDPPASTDVDRVVVYYAGLLGRWKRVAPWATRNQPVPVPTISDALGSTPPPGISTFPTDIGTPGVLASATGGLALYGNGKAEVAREAVDPVDVVNRQTMDAAIDGPTWSTPTSYNAGFSSRPDNPVQFQYHRDYLEMTGSVGGGSVAAGATVRLFNIAPPGVEKVVYGGGGANFRPGRIIFYANGEVWFNNGSSASVSIVYFDGIRIRL